jgi:phosphatidylinositol 4-kinase
MQTKLEPIAQQIEANLTVDAKKFYERVFAFSDRLTKVSDIIKGYPKGNERKEGMNYSNFNIKFRLFVF